MNLEKIPDKKNFLGSFPDSTFITNVNLTNVNTTDTISLAIPSNVVIGAVILTSEM